MDLADWTAAGLYDAADAKAAERLALLGWLSEQGFTLEQMVVAHARGRLFGLAGDEAMRPGRDQLTLADAAQRAGLSGEVMLSVWRALGFPDPDPDAHILSPTEADAFAIFNLTENVFGSDASRQIGRVISAAMSSIAEAENAVVINTLPAMNVDNADELTTAQVYLGISAFFEPVGRLLDVLHRYQIDLSARRREQLASPDGGQSLRIGIGFVDLVGYTSLSQHLTTGEMGALVSSFEDDVSSVVTERGGRIVKFLGDGAMFASNSPAAACTTAVALTHAFTVRDDRPTVRVGAAWGDVLPQRGDYFGPVVNLAARIVTLASPGTAVVSTPLRDAAGDVAGLSFEARAAQVAKGIDEPVEIFAVTAV